MTSSGIKIQMKLNDMLYFFPSMVAEIGGYSGLLVGFSLMDIATIFKSFRLYFK